MATIYCILRSYFSDIFVNYPWCSSFKWPISLLCLFLISTILFRYSFSSDTRDLWVWLIDDSDIYYYLMALTGYIAKSFRIPWSSIWSWRSFDLRAWIECRIEDVGDFIGSLKLIRICDCLLCSECYRLFTIYSCADIWMEGYSTAHHSRKVYFQLFHHF
jgi:hypothetical protein